MLAAVAKTLGEYSEQEGYRLLRCSLDPYGFQAGAHSMDGGGAPYCDSDEQSSADAAAGQALAAVFGVLSPLERRVKEALGMHTENAIAVADSRENAGDDL